MYFELKFTPYPNYIFFFLYFVPQLHDGRSYSRAVGYSSGLPPSNRQGSHEREITNIDAGNNFGNNRTTV
ncbi:hypothetical protein GGR06_003646 [Bacteroides reticulotermitis]|uniref:Uncharacterized protein n=1 Tax=Bacteroides reticulotermitis TaxID=1133319 RepID=A0A840D8P5_9BACE|nr:hypothetical protein [Bacteroides reticulotermitis]